jgi:hypothetical protein
MAALSHPVHRVYHGIVATVVIILHLPIADINHTPPFNILC